MLENKCRSDYNSLKHWNDIQQKIEHILTKLTKDFDETTQCHTLFQLEESSKNLTLNLNEKEHIENLFKEGRQAMASLDESNQDSLICTLEQYEVRWKDLRERLNKKLQETGKQQ